MGGLMLAELEEWYKNMDLPNTSGLVKEELVTLMKNAVTWSSLPVSELKLECGPAILSGSIAADWSDEKIKEFCADRLLEQECLKLWDARGFSASQIGYKDVVDVIRQYNEFESMTDEELKLSYTAEGLLHDAGAKRDDFLRVLKKVLVWEALPLPALETECLECDLPIEASDSGSSEEEKRDDLTKQLKVGMTKTAYEARGIPVSRIGLRKAHKLRSKLESLETMDDHELEAECAIHSIPQPRGTGRVVMISRLRNVMLWKVQSAAELWAACQSLGLEDRLRETMLAQLTNALDRLPVDRPEDGSTATPGSFGGNTE